MIKIDLSSTAVVRSCQSNRPVAAVRSVSNSSPSSKSKNPNTHSTELVEHRAVGVEETGQPGAAVGGLG